MDKRTLLIGGLLAVIAVALGSLLLRGPDGPKLNLSPFAALGAVAGEETSRLLHHTGTVVVVTEDPGRDGDPVVEAQLGEFKAALRRSGAVRVKAAERMRTDPMTRFSTGGTMPPDQFAAVRTKHPDAAALVLFVPFPVLPAAEQSAIKSGRQLMVVASAVVPGYRQLVSSGVIRLALVPKPAGTPAPPGTPRSTREWFDRDYMVVTPETAELLPY